MHKAIFQNNLNNTAYRSLLRIVFIMSFLFFMGELNATELELSPTPEVAVQLQQQYAWKSQSQIRESLGEPIVVRAPIGTHATYTLWEYDQLIFAFANERVIHVFSKNALHIPAKP